MYITYIPNIIYVFYVNAALMRMSCPIDHENAMLNVLFKFDVHQENMSGK